MLGAVGAHGLLRDVPLPVAPERAAAESAPSPAAVAVAAAGSAAVRMHRP